MKTFQKGQMVLICLPSFDPFNAVISEDQTSDKIKAQPERGLEIEIESKYVHADPFFFEEKLRILSEAIHLNAISKGFWDGERNFGEMIALMQSELSEALEAERHGNPPSEKISPYSHVEEELADCIIRILDTSVAYGFDIYGAILSKMDYNKDRPYKHDKKF